MSVFKRDETSEVAPVPKKKSASRKGKSSKTNRSRQLVINQKPKQVTGPASLFVSSSISIMLDKSTSFNVSISFSYSSLVQSVKGA